MNIARVVQIAAMSLLIMEFATVQSKAETVQVTDPIAMLTVPEGTVIDFHDTVPGLFDVNIGGTDFPAKSFFDVFVTIDLPPGTYNYCYNVGSTGCSGPTVQIGQLEVVNPLPAALPLFATGLGVMGFLGWRRKRKAAAIAA